jgi:hypothetical protein
VADCSQSVWEWNDRSITGSLDLRDRQPITSLHSFGPGQTHSWSMRSTQMMSDGLRTLVRAAYSSALPRRIFLPNFPRVKFAHSGTTLAVPTSPNPTMLRQRHISSSPCAHSLSRIAPIDLSSRIWSHSSTSRPRIGIGGWIDPWRSS